MWAKNVAAKLKALEGQSEKAIKTVYAKIRSTKRSADKRKNQSSAVFMTSYAKIKSLPFTARKQKPVNRFKLASILLAIILGFSLYQGTSAVVNYLGSPTNPAQKSWVERVSKKRVKRLKKKKLYKKTAKAKIKSKKKLKKKPRKISKKKRQKSKKRYKRKVASKR